MIIRRYRHSDLEAVSKLWEKHHSHSFSLPTLEPSIINAVVEDAEGKIVAFGNLKVYAECVMVMDHDRPKSLLARAFKRLMETAILAARRNKIQKVHAVSLDPDFAELLRKHYGFSDVTGEHLVRESN